MRARAQRCRECKAAVAIEHCAARASIISAESGVAGVAERIEGSAVDAI